MCPFVLSMLLIIAQKCLWFKYIIAYQNILSCILGNCFLLAVHLL